MMQKIVKIGIAFFIIALQGYKVFAALTVYDLQRPVSLPSSMTLTQSQSSAQGQVSTTIHSLVSPGQSVVASSQNSLNIPHAYYAQGARGAVYIPSKAVESHRVAPLQARNIRSVSDDYVKRNPMTQVQGVRVDQDNHIIIDSDISESIFLERLDEGLLRQERAESPQKSAQEAKKSFWQKFLDYTSRRKGQASVDSAFNLLLDISHDAQDVERLELSPELRLKFDHFMASLSRFFQMSVKDPTQLKYVELSEFANSFKEFESSAKQYKPEQLRRWKITSLLHKISDFFTFVFYKEQAPLVFAQPVPATSQLLTKNNQDFYL